MGRVLHEPLRVSTRELGAAVHVRPTGELDAATAPALRTTLERLSERGRRTVLELDGLTAIDSTGIGLLVHERELASAHGWQLTVTPARAPVMRVLRLAGVCGYVLTGHAPAGGGLVHR